MNLPLAAKTILKIIHTSSIFMHNLTEDALDLSRFERNKFQLNEEMVDIRDIVKSVIEIMEF